MARQDYTDEEIGRAVREYLEAPKAGFLVAHGGRLLAGDDVVYRLQQAAKNLRENADRAQCTPYTTADLRAALAAEREAEAKTERINDDIWSDEYAPEPDSPLLAGVFGAETVPEWLGSDVSDTPDETVAVGIDSETNRIVFANHFGLTTPEEVTRHLCGALTRAWGTEEDAMDAALAQYGVGPWTCIGAGVARFNEHGLAAARVYSLNSRWLAWGHECHDHTDSGEAPDIEAAKSAADAALLKHLRER